MKDIGNFLTDLTILNVIMEILLFNKNKIGICLYFEYINEIFFED